MRTKDFTVARSRSLTAALASATAAVVLLGAPQLASATTKITCSAKMSVPAPHQNTTTVVEVHSIGTASVTTVAHYKSTATSHTGTTNSAGNVNISYAISRATIGYKVVVNVTVSKKGDTTGTCSTSFTPSK